MATTKTYTFVNSQPADATQVNKNFDDLLAGINADVSATDKVLGRATAGAGPVEEIPCTAAGRALIDDADAAAQRATLGNVVVTGDSRLSDARVASDVSAWAKAASKPSYTAAEVGTRTTATGMVTTVNGTDVVVTHGLGTIPSFISIISLTDTGTSSGFSISARTTTTFTIVAKFSTMCLWIAFA